MSRCRKVISGLLLQVYGDPLEHPQTESYWGNVNCIGERSCYDEGKRAAECLTFDYQREHNLEVSEAFPGRPCIACHAEKAASVKQGLTASTSAGSRSFSKGKGDVVLPLLSYVQHFCRPAVSRKMTHDLWP